MARLAGRSAIVTGGAKGIGRHYSRALAAEGARVMIADIADGRELAQELALQRCTGRLVPEVAPLLRVRFQIEQLAVGLVPVDGDLVAGVDKGAEVHRRGLVAELDDQFVTRTSGIATCDVNLRSVAGGEDDRLGCGRPGCQ